MKQPTITFEKSAGMLILLDILELEPICSFCSVHITEENLGGIFPNPTRVCCTNICCLMEAISGEEQITQQNSLTKYDIIVSDNHGNHCISVPKSKFLT